MKGGVVLVPYPPRLHGRAGEGGKALGAGQGVVVRTQVYSYVYGNPDLDFVSHETLDLDVFRDGIRKKINEKVGEDLIHEVLVEQVDFLSKDEIRDNTIRRRMQAGQTARGEMAKGFNNQPPPKSH